MLDPEPRVVVTTHGADGGEWTAGPGESAPWMPAGARSGAWAAASPPGPPVDAYGCGDSFAGGLTYGLAAELGLERALALGARCGAACLTGRGPYAAQYVS
ncbi:MAG: hypothetical protein H0T43_09575 [Solirubrobacterales bacterium]|nr:hypothetical protein [Solirubrobacterales bacterium]